MSYTIPTAAITTAANTPMQFVAEVTTAGSEENGQALLYSDTTLTTYLADAASTAAEVTAIEAYTDGYTAGFTYTLSIAKTTAAAAPAVTATDDTAQTQEYGACFTGTITPASGTAIAGTSCAAMEFTYTNSNQSGSEQVAVAWKMYYAPDQTDTVTLTAASGTWESVTVNATNAGLSKSWACSSTGNTFPITSGGPTQPEIMTCARFLPLEANTASTDIRFDAQAAFTGAIKLLATDAAGAIQLTASATTALTGAFQAATVAGAVALAALTF